jgi:hypothetical protein
MVLLSYFSPCRFQIQRLIQYLTSIRGNIIWSMVTGIPPMIDRPTLTGSEFLDIPPSLINYASSTLTVLEFGEEIMSLLQFMSRLTITQIKLIHTPSVTAEEIMVFNKLRAAVEHRLLSVRVATPVNVPRKQLEAAVYEACQIAALMCSNCIFREFTPRTNAFRGLRERIAHPLMVMETLRDVEDGHDFDELLLWIYFIGGMLSPSAETKWYALRVSRLMSSLIFEGWPEVENCLARCLWAERMQNNTYCAAFWEAVRSCSTAAFEVADWRNS